MPVASTGDVFSGGAFAAEAISAVGTDESDAFPSAFRASTLKRSVLPTIVIGT